jgi:hypothetical protein
MKYPDRLQLVLVMDHVIYIAILVLEAIISIQVVIMFIPCIDW